MTRCAVCDTALAADRCSGRAFRGRVVSVIGEQLASRRACTAATVAKELCITVRTLQRRLESEGTSFRAVLDDYRLRMARAYLASSDLSLGEIAYLLGFSTTQAFHRAFKRWSGGTPVTVRATLVGTVPDAADRIGDERPAFTTVDALGHI